MRKIYATVFASLRTRWQERKRASGTHGHEGCAFQKLRDEELRSSVMLMRVTEYLEACFPLITPSTHVQLPRCIRDHTNVIVVT